VTLFGQEFRCQFADAACTDDEIFSHFDRSLSSIIWRSLLSIYGNTCERNNQEQCSLFFAKVMGDGVIRGFQSWMRSGDERLIVIDKIQK
jgi:hypothetical protein